MRPAFGDIGAIGADRAALRIVLCGLRRQRLRRHRRIGFVGRWDAEQSSGGGSSRIGRIRSGMQRDRLMSAPLPACEMSISSSTGGGSGRPSGAMRLRQDVGMRLADAARPRRRIAVHREIEMEVIVVQEVVARARAPW